MQTRDLVVLGELEQGELHGILTHLPGVYI